MKPMMLRSLSASFCLIAAAGCASSGWVPPAPPPAAAVNQMLVSDPPRDDDRIVPGWRIGQIHLWMSGKQLLQTMGEPNNSAPIFGFLQYEFRERTPRQIYVSVTKSELVVFAMSTTENSLSYATAEGIRIGSSELTLRTTFGAPDTQQPLENNFSRWCYKRGLQVTVNGSGRVFNMSVFPADRDSCG